MFRLKLYYSLINPESCSIIQFLVEAIAAKPASADSSQTEVRNPSRLADKLVAERAI